MTINPDAELVTALHFAVQFMEDLAERHEIAVATLRAGERTSEARLRVIEARLAVTRAEIDGFRRRVEHLVTLQRAH
jgi:hypothetical protein